MQNERVEQFLTENKVGLLLRTFATKPEDVLERVTAIQKTLDKIGRFEIDGKSVFSHTDILVWRDRRYVHSDCGETADALKQATDNVSIQEMDGDIYCDLMNSGFAIQNKAGIDYTLTISPDANSYATPETLQLVLEAASRGALVVGVAIDELADSILRGRVANTFAMWHDLTILGVGGFNQREARPITDPRLTKYIMGYENDRPVYYPFAGVEEVIPLARIFDRLNRPFIAPVLPLVEGSGVYEKPTDPDLLARHEIKMSTKLERQMGMLLAEGYNFSWLEAAVMPEYRQF
jgi:hypothetical protein